MTKVWLDLFPIYAIKIPNLYITSVSALSIPMPLHTGW